MLNFKHLIRNVTSIPKFSQCARYSQFIKPNSVKPKTFYSSLLTFGIASGVVFYTTTHTVHAQTKSEFPSLRNVIDEVGKQDNLRDKLAEFFLDERIDVSLAHRTTSDLIRSLIVFELCQYPILVDVAPSVIKFCQNVFLDKPLFWLVKQSFFSQFCGGERAEEVIPLIKQLETRNIGAILDFSSESDIDNSAISDEEKALHVVNVIKECIQVAKTSEGNFAAVKLTGIGSTTALKNISAVFSLLWDTFRIVSDGKHAVKFEQFDSIVRVMPGFNHFTAEMSPNAINSFITDLFVIADLDKDGFVDWADISAVLDISNADIRPLFLGCVKVPTQFPIHHSESKIWSISEKYQPEVSEENYQEFLKIISRLDSICKTAYDAKVRLMIDAEQSYFQPAIDYIARQMMQKYNQCDRKNECGNCLNGPLIYNTYQLYLKDGYARMFADLQHAHRSHFIKRDELIHSKPEVEQAVIPYQFAVKIVRGAYMTSEKKRAEILGIRNPINESYEQTSIEYHKAISLLIETSEWYAKNNQSIPADFNKSPVSFVIASHNKDSIIFALKKMNLHQINSQDGTVYFAQLLGMHDHVTYTLAKNGFLVSKYIPFGPVGDVIPYLLRRAQENKSVLGPQKGGLDDRTLLRKELKKRFFGDSEQTIKESEAVAAQNNQE